MSTKKYIGGPIQIVDGTQGEGKILMSDSVGLSSWSYPTTFSVATASDSTLGGIIVGTGLTMSNSGVLSLSSLGISYTAGPGLTLSGSTFSLSTKNYKIVYVSANGSDSNDGLSDLTPFLSIKTARDLAVSGDTVIVMPGTYTYDNRASNSLFWNGKQGDINLWKNGVTYYFEPGSKIVFYNQIITGEDLYLFSPVTTTGETCTVLGHLEYEQYGAGTDGSGTIAGHNAFYAVGAAYGGTAINANAHTFYAELKSLYSEHCEFININRSVVGISETKITIITESEIKKSILGQSGRGCAVYVSGIQNGATDDPYLTLILSSKYRDSSGAWGGQPFFFRGNLNGSNLNIFGDVNIQRGNGNVLREGKFTLNYNIKKTYYTTHSNNWFGGFVSTSSFNNGTFNVKGDLIDYLDNIYTTGVFHIGNTSSNNIFNFDGNITTKSSSGIGRFIAMTNGTVTGNIINIKGDINYIGTASTTQYMFRSGGGVGNIINYSGKVTGNFACPIANCYSGIININNSNIISLVSGSASSVLLNGSTTQGTVRINNSYIQLSNSENSVGDGSYVKVLINNSSLINSGTSSVISNTTNFGTLQIVNSLLYATTTPINYTGTASVIVSNVTTNVLCVGSIIGGIDLISDLTF